jgi:hypothetical protein
MKRVVLALTLVALARASFGTTLIVDKYGGGQFTSIQPAIDVASASDTVKVWPGYYQEQINLNKNIVLMGSGYENTVITGSFNPVATVSSGALQWFQVTSLNGVGVVISGGVVRNCVIRDCATMGVNTTTGNGSLINCVIWNCGYGDGAVRASGGTLTATNCISRNNSSQGFNGWAGTLQVNYCNGSRTYTSGGQGCIDVDPQFVSNTDFHIPDGSPCWNTGTTALADPDGSRSGMGYFGGTDCPIYPTVFEIIITPSGGTVNITAKGRANY